MVVVMIMVVIVIVTVPITVVAPAVAVGIPPAMVASPAVLSCFAEFVPPMFGL